MMDDASNRSNRLPSDINTEASCAEGKKKINWAWSGMPVLRHIADEFSQSKPLNGLRIAVSVHVEAKTACLVRTLALGGADVALTGCNPLSTQDDIAAALADEGFFVYCKKGVSEENYRQHLRSALAINPHLVIDDGGDFAQLLHSSGRESGRFLIGGCEETTTGIRRLRLLAKDNRLLYPVIAVNDARCKHLFDNRFGTGQSVWTAIMDTTNLLIAGKTVVVSGFGMCGRGVAQRARGLGARILVTEVDPVKACEALMEGYDVAPMTEAARIGDIFVTVTGCKDVITIEHMNQMKDGAVLCNAGHFDVEISMRDLEQAAIRTESVRENIMTYTLENGRRVNVLASGRLVNLAAGDGHPIEIMDMSFSLQALAVLYLARHGKEMKPDVYALPRELDDSVAQRLLDHLNKPIDRLNASQEHYLNNWQ